MKAAFSSQLEISGLVLLFHNRGVRKVVSQAGAFNLDALLIGIALGEDGEFVAAGKLRECIFHSAGDIAE